MAAIVTHRLRHLQARLFYDRLVNSVDSLYLGIGRSNAWATENSPPTPTVTSLDELEARQALQSIKKISNFSYAAPRYNWTSGTTYIAYDNDDPLLHTKKYFVFNPSNFNVYICLKAGSGASTVEPTSTSTSVPTAGADGYIWKYLYNIDSPTANKFLTTEYIPVLRNSSVAAAAVRGAIHNVKIEAGGSYGSTPTLVFEGDGTGAAGTATLTAGVITNITMTNVGSGYTYCKVTTTGGSPTTTATLRPILAPVALGREIHDLDVTTGGSGYTNGSGALVFTGDGYSAAGTNTVSSGAFVNGSDTISNAGYNYTQCVVTPSQQTSGTTAVFRVNFSGPKGGFGYDPVVDLNARYLMFNVELDGAEGSGDFIISQDYRQLVLLKNPLTKAATPTKFTDTTGSCLRYLEVDTGGTFVVDNIIQGGSSGARAYIDKYENDSSPRVFYHQDETTGFKSFTSGESLTAISGGTSTGDITSGGHDGEPEVDPYSGELLFLENRVAISRTADQTESVKIAILF